ncbi:MAG TPA: L-seryl-tRNA(Sec) selenium transferase [Gemmatimonadetes bacterium]|nr:L-seryl-tRNA(Sec) selenium transferase [Gemmatimonadota bacterium]
MSDARRLIPSLERLLESDAFAGILEAHPRGLVVQHLRTELGRVRRELNDGKGSVVDPGALPRDVEDPQLYAVGVEERLRVSATPSLRSVINGTGVILHTNLGRAPLADSALDAMASVARGYANLEYDLEAGSRGSRYDHCTDLLRELTGAGGALVSNNGAAALVLALRTMAFGRAVLVSRGELVEIGGGFRIPEILESAGATLSEVGSTNRTRLEDYRAGAAKSDPALILKVHRSNFRITGFTEEASLRELVGLGAELGVPVVYDLGSGLLADPERLGLPREPGPAESLAVGADILAFSGDKLLGGPQAGILLGKAEWVDQMRKNPWCRAVRVDKTALAGLEATLQLYRDPETALREIPVLAMLSTSLEVLRERAETMAASISEGGVVAEVIETTSVVGGGTYPGVELESCGVRVDSKEEGADPLAARLRGASVPLVGRVEDGAFWIDLRTVLPWQDTVVVDLLSRHTGL